MVAKSRKSPIGVESIRLEDFGPFEKLDLRFSAGINVFLGENATGKTMLMKLLYGFHCAYEGPGRNYDGGEGRVAPALQGLFRPESDIIERLVRRGRSRAGIKFSAEGETATCHFGQKSFMSNGNAMGLSRKAVFIPAREVLSLYEGFIGAYERRELSFDRTYYDICVSLNLSRLKKPRSEMLQLRKTLEAVVGGEVRLRGDRFYVGRSDGDLEAQLLAEGHRKLATVARLLDNGTIGKETVLFWDEPEANLNPRLASTVVKLLVELARAGVQVFLASHDFLLTQELSLLAEARQFNELLFFSFAVANGSVSAQSAPTLAEIDNNPILHAFAGYYEHERRLLANGHDAEPTSK